MTKIIPDIKSKNTKMTPGERRFGESLEALLEDDYSCWFDIPVGDKRRYPDFIILHPSRGLLLIEVKDWKADKIKSFNHHIFELLTDIGPVSKTNPIEQVRQSTYQLINKLKRDPALIQTEGKHKGNLICPYGYGVVFTNITRKDLNRLLGEEGADVLPEHLVICQDEMREKVDAEEFQQRLWNMFNYQFPQKLSLPQVDRIRAHVFPEIRIDYQNNLFFDEEASGVNQVAVPDIIKVMDVQQEQLARSFGDGHRIVHGVAGSGKTLILGFRCWYLAQTQSKPILVLCYNISLAAKLRSYMRARGIEQQVQVYHFHDWCGQQLKTYHVDLIKGAEPVWERQVISVIRGVENQQIPREQYGAVLIDEGHDFEAEWLKLVVQMIDSESNSLLLLYDDAQSIYKKKNQLDFSLSSVGIQARGRTTILKLNYRNTREILEFAFNFAKDYLNIKSADDDGVPLIRPEVAGNSGAAPQFKMIQNKQHEIEFIRKCLIKWHQDGIAWSDMAVIYCETNFSKQLQKELIHQSVPTQWLISRESRRSYDPEQNKVTLVTRESSKGLEFSRVIVAGLGEIKHTEESEQPQEARLLYVAMTRAKEILLLTSSKENCYTRQLSEHFR